MKCLAVLTRALLLSQFLFGASTVGAQTLASGTGFFVSGNGLLVTNYHVIEGASELAVKRPGEYDIEPATVVAVDKANDLAVLRVQLRSQVRPLPIANSLSVRRGAKVVTVGFPRVSIQGAEPKVTDGLVSGLSGITGAPTYFQISVPIQPGNSGGPLVTEDGAVVGIVSSTLNPKLIARLEGNVPQNVNYAVKSNYLLELLNVIDAKSVPTPASSPPLRMEALVSRVEAAIALVLAQASTASASPPPPKPIAGHGTADLRGLEFSGIRMYRAGGSLFVEDSSSSTRVTSLRNGDQILRCYYNQPPSRVVYVEYPVDIKECSSPSSDQDYFLLVRRAGSDVEARIAK